MIPNTKDRNLESHGVADSGSFDISFKDSAHLMTILRDTLYSDKILAVLREYSANAWDAHREVGKGDVPIFVRLPTRADPNLIIRDVGPGLSHEDIFTVYVQYGASTKRNNDTSVGMLGIGSKSGFAYSDSFTVTSWHGGKKRTYVAVLDASDKGVMNLLQEEDCNDNETGVQIQIAARTEDIWEFESKARKLFYHFNPRPDINITLADPTNQETTLVHGSLVSDASCTWTAVMGCVPYKIDINQLRDPDGKLLIGEYIEKLSGHLNLNIGDVQISASREELKYGTSTKKKLVEKFGKLIDEFVTSTFKIIEGNTLSRWERKVRGRLFGQLGLPIPKKWAKLILDFVTVDNAKTFTLTSGKNAIHNIHITEESAFVLRDDLRSLDGFQLQRNDYLVRPLPGNTLEEARAELDDIITNLDITGIPVKLLSSYQWTMPKKMERKLSLNSKKYQVSTFRYKEESKAAPPWSQCWEIERRTPDEEDVFVILKNFKCKDFSFYRSYRDDRALAKAFNSTLPPVYGYKSTEHDPKTTENCIGTYYEEWRPLFAMSLITPDIQKLIDHWIWSKAITGYGVPSMQSASGKKAVQELVDGLGEFHPITQVAIRQQAGCEVIDKMDTIKQEHLSTLCSRLVDNDDTETSQALEELYRIYPLLSVEHIRVLWGAHGSQWLDYIRLVDRALAMKAAEE